MYKKIFSLVHICAMCITLSGCGVFETLSSFSKGQPTSFSDVNDLESGKAYVWHHEGGNIYEDIKKTQSKAVFFGCIKGDNNFQDKAMEDSMNYPRTIWMDSNTDKNIPTVTSEDKLLYVSSTLVPDSFTFERFADYGYTIGVANMIADGGGHYYIEYAVADEDDYKYYLDLESDAAQLTELDIITKLYLDKVGDIKVTEDSVSDGGTVLGLTKDKKYKCEFYTGTYYQDYALTANIHTFTSMESFTSYDYEFAHSRFIVIEIPDYFKSGYYMLNGVGLFRYVADEDIVTYNGEPYDSNINWNDPIILYDKDGSVIYDPSNPEIYEEEPVYDDADAGVPEDELKKETKEGSE